MPMTCTIYWSRMKASRCSGSRSTALIAGPPILLFEGEQCGFRIFLPKTAAVMSLVASMENVIPLPP